MCERPNVPRSDAHDLGELEKPLRDRLWTAMQHSPRNAVHGTPGIALVSGYRDPGRQWDLRHDRVPHGQECNPAVKARPATAVPYASDHGRRKAADMGGVDLLWLYANCRAFGLWHNVSTENWHYIASGTPTVAIIEYPGVAYDNAGPIAKPNAPAPTPKDWFDMATEAELRKIIKEELGPVTLRLIALDRTLTTISTRLGSAIGWAKAHALKAGVSRDDAVKNDPTHKD